MLLALIFSSWVSWPNQRLIGSNLLLWFPAPTPGLESVRSADSWLSVTTGEGAPGRSTPQLQSSSLFSEFLDVPRNPFPSRLISEVAVVPDDGQWSGFVPV